MVNAIHDAVDRRRRVRVRSARSTDAKPGCAVTRLNQQRLKHGVPRGLAARALPMMRDHACWLAGRHERRRGRCAAPGALIPASCRRVAPANSSGMRSGPQGRRRSRQVFDGNPRIVGPSIHRGVLLAERHAREDRAFGSPCDVTANTKSTFGRKPFGCRRWRAGPDRKARVSPPSYPRELRAIERPSPIFSIQRAGRLPSRRRPRKSRGRPWRRWPVARCSRYGQPV